VLLITSVQKGRKKKKSSFLDSVCVIKQTMNSQKRLRNSKEMAQPIFTMQIHRIIRSIIISHSEIQARKPKVQSKAIPAVFINESQVFT